MSTTAGNKPSRQAELILTNAHGTVMVIGWMIFASTGILFARYGRSLRIGMEYKLFGEAIWFQIHRFVLLLAAVATLLGFFLIFSEVQGKWIRSNEGLTFIHSVFGGIIVCCALLQTWMALFRCHPDSPFRFIYNWLHRITGSLAFFLTVPTIFLIIVHMKTQRVGLIIIMSLWSAWVIIIAVLLEIIRLYFSRMSSLTVNRTTEDSEYELANLSLSPIGNMQQVDNAHNKRINNIILILLFVHMIVAIALATSFIVLIWQ